MTAMAPSASNTVAASLDPGGDDAGLSAATPWRDFWSAFKENRGALIGLAVVLAIALVAIFANVLAPYSPYEQFRDAVKAPPVWADGGTCERSAVSGRTSSTAKRYGR